MNYVTIWQYKIKPRKEIEFEKLYGSDGDWVKLFQKFHGYIKTELHKNINDPDVYITLDYWESKEDYYLFKKQSKEDFLKIDEFGEDLTNEERHIGEFLITN